MLTPRQIQGIANDITSIYSNIESQCIKSIAKAINSGSKIKSASLWQMKKLSDIGLLKKDLLASISTATKKSVREVNALVTKALQESSWNDSQTLGSLSHYRNMSKADYIAKITQSETFQKVLDKTLAGVKNGINLTNTKALQGSVIAYTKAINNAYLAMATGNTTFEDAVRNAVSQIGLSGISIVDSKSKVRDKELIKKNGELYTTYSDGSKIRMYPLDSAVRRDITTQINQASATLTLQDCQELGVSLVETSWHNGARPEHEVWQGQVFSLDQKNTKYGYFYGSLDAGLPAYGDPLGICGINCYHSFSPYLEGSPKADQTGKKSAEENAKQYANQQKQRAYERNLRALKRQQIALKSCGYYDEASFIQSKINSTSLEYRQFLKDTGLTRISMLERIKSNKEVPEYKPIKGLRETPTTEMLDYLNSHSLSNSELLTPQTAKEYLVIKEKEHVPSEFTPLGIIDKKVFREDKVFVNRYYFDLQGKKYKDISNNGHGEKGKKKYGKNGEHAHDWVWENNKARRNKRNLTDKEKEECKDILE